MGQKPDTNARRVAPEAVLAPTGWADAPLAYVTRLAAAILDVPIALLSLPRADEYRFRVNVGLDGYESVPCRISFCAYTMLGTDVLLVSDARVDPRFRGNPLVLGAPHVVTYVGVPLVSARGVTLGTICAIDRVPREFTASQLDQLRDLARIAGWLLETESAQSAERRASGSRVMHLEDSRDAERERLALALHEGVAQDLFGLRLQLQRLRASSAWRPEADAVAAAADREFTRALDRSISDVCELANGLMPGGVANLRVADVIRQQADEVTRQTGLEIQVNETGTAAAMAAGTRLLVLRAAREALANVARHARACRVAVSLDCGPKAVRLRVVDDGVGVEHADLSNPGALGLASLRERAHASGGELQVERNARGGTTLTLLLPRGAILPR